MEEAEPRAYNIVRFFRNSGCRRAIRKRVTLAEAQQHCQDPETSSSTCRGEAGKRRTWRNGPWFDGYEAR